MAWQEKNSVRHPDQRLSCMEKNKAIIAAFARGSSRKVLKEERGGRRRNDFGLYSD